MSAPMRSARFAISFMKLILVASIAFAAYFVSSAERTSMTIMRSRLRVNGSYSDLSSSAVRGLSVPTTTRSGFMKSLIAAPSFRNSGFETTSNSTLTRALAERLLDALLDLVGRADRHRRLVDDDAVFGHVAADGLGDGEHVREVGRAVLVGRGADGDELEQAVADALFRVGRELEAPLLEVALHQHVEARLVDGDVARLQARDLAGVDVDADDVVAGFGKAGARHQADVA